MKNYVSKSYTNDELERMFKEVFGYDHVDPNEEDDTMYTEYDLEMLRESQKPSQIDVNFDDEYEWAKNKMTESKKRYVCSSTRWGLVYRGLTLDGNVRLPFEARSVSELAKLYPQYWHEVV